MTAPGKVLANNAGEEGAKRFKFTLLHKRLRESDAHHVSLQPVPVAEENVDVVTSHLGTALHELMERNRTEHFNRYALDIREYTLSLPLVLRGRALLLKKSCDALQLAAREQPLSIEPIALCIAALARDLGIRYFGPFFPNVVTAFANVFNIPNNTQLFWDPHVAVLPIFSALAAITKVLLVHLVSNPVDTISQLSPLIGHEQYRIREMTAESSLGYMLKKTRQKELRDALIAQVVQVADEASVTDIENNSIVHGAGVSLFEASTSLSGALHSRAESVLNSALEACVTTNVPVFRRRVAVLAHSVARLCLHVKANKESVTQVIIFLITATDKGVEGKQWQATAAALFLLRHSLPVIVGNSENTLPEAHGLRISNVLVKCVSNFYQNEQVCFEGFGCFLSLLPCLNPRRSRQTLAALKKLLDGHLKQMPLMTIRKVLDLCRSKEALKLLSNPSLDVMPILSIICDTLAPQETHLAEAVSSELVDSAPTGRGKKLPTCEALFSAVLFIRHSTSVSTAFHSPTLNKQVEEAFSGLVKAFVDGKVCLLESRKRFPPVAQTILDYIQFSRVPSIVPHLARLASCQLGLGFLGPIACATVRYELTEESNAVVFRLLKLLASETVPESVLIALNLFCKSTGCQLVRARLSEEEIQSIALNLSMNLSSSSSVVRKESAILVLHLISSIVGGDEVESSGDEIMDNFQHHRAMEIRMKLGTHVAGECPDRLIFSSILTVLVAPYQLDCIPIVREIFDKLAALARKTSCISNLSHIALSHFTIGMFSVRFRPFWEPSRGLWGALAESNAEEARKPMVSALLSASKQVVQYYSEQRITTNTTEGHFEDEDENETNTHLEEGKTKKLKTTKSAVRKRPRPPGSDKTLLETQRRSHPINERWIKQKKRKSDIAFTLLWAVNEWETQPKDASQLTDQFLHSPGQFVYDGDLESTSADPLTTHLEYLKVLSQFPKSTIEIRAIIVDELYLALDPTLLSKLAGNKLVKKYGLLMEKMGGLKISENSKSRENRLRTRLLQDLCRPDSVSQAEVMRCLCTSRSPELKPYKESLLRIIDDKTFREEVAIITESLSETNPVSNLDTTKKPSRIVLSEPMVDVLVRICYSKMRGNRQKFRGRRSAAVDFVSSCLASSNAVLKLVKLILHNLMPIIDDIASEQELLSSVDSVDLSTRDYQLPSENIYRATLTSLEVVLKHARRSILPVTWRQIAIAMFLILSKSVSSSNNQDIRSDALRLIAFMMQKNSDLTYFVCSPALKLMKLIGATSSSPDNITSAPALLKFLAACMKSEKQEFVHDLVRTHFSVCEWGLRIVSAETTTVGTVELVMEVAVGIVSIGHTTTLTDSDTVVIECREKLIQTLAASIRIRLCTLLESGDENWHRVKSNRDVLHSIVTVLAKVCDCSELNMEVTASLADSLLIVITESKLTGLTLLASIKAFELLISRLCAEEARDSIETKFLPRLIPLFGSPRHSNLPDVKDALCRVLRKFGNASLRMVSHLVSDMAAMDASRIGEPDLDTRVQAFNTLITILKRALALESNTHDSPCIVIQSEDIKSSRSFLSEETEEKKESAVWCKNTFLLALHASVSAIAEQDVSVRGTGSYTLQLLVRWILFAKATDLNSIASTVAELIASKGLNSTAVESRRELCKSLGNLVRDNDLGASNDSSELIRGLHHLTESEHLEADFFENVAHIQMHRRGRALRRMLKKLESMNTKKDTHSLVATAVRRFIFPLAMRLALESPENGNERGKSRNKVNETKLSYNRDVSKSAVELNRICALYLPWKEYRKELTSVIRRISKESDEVRTEILYSVLVGLTDAFPGSIWDTHDPDMEQTRKSFIESYLLPKLISFISSGSVEGEVRITANNAKQDKSGDEDRSLKTNIFRAPIGVAAAKLMSQLDEGSLNQAIPSLVTPLSNALRSRMNDIRVQSKKVLVDVVLLLDPRFFSYVIDQVLSALVNGYRKDSIIHVIHTILSGIQDFRNQVSDGSDKTKDFPVDSAVEKLCQAMATELEDGVHASKTDYLNPNASDSRLKESSHRASKVSDAAQIIASLIHFPTSARNVLKPFSRLLVSATSSKLCSRVQDVLQKIMVGFSKNVSVTADEGLKLAYDLVHSNMPSPSLLVDDGTEDKTALRDQLLALMSGRQFSNSPGSHILAELGWQLVNSLLSKNIVCADGKSTESRKVQSKIEPFVAELLLSMRSRYDSLTRVSLKCAQRILRLPMPNRRNIADVMAATTVEVLCRNLGVSMNRGTPMDRGTLLTDDGLFTTCLRAAAVLIQEIGHNEKTGIKRERIVALLQISKNILDQCSVEARAGALSLIKSTISAKITIPEVYDTLEHVSKLAIEVQSPSLKSSCIGMVVQFLVSFPLSKKRIQQHLEFVVRNLSYELPHGRIAAINIIVALCQQFPEQKLNEEAEYLVISLMAVVARDMDRYCRKTAASALQTIFSSVRDGRVFDSLLKMALGLLAVSEKNKSKDSASDTGDPDLLRAGAITITSAALSGKLSNEQLKTCASCVSSASLKFMSMSWETVHALLSCFESIVDAQPKNGQMNDQIELLSNLKAFWGAVNDHFLLHKHEWVRLGASRLLGRHISSAGGRDAKFENNQTSLYCVLWTRDGTLRSILKSLCLQFEASQLSEDLAKQTLKNVLCISNMIWKCPQAGNVGSIDHDVTDVGKEKNRPLTWIISRMSGMCTRVGTEESAFLRRACALRFLMQAVKWWGADVVNGRLYSFVAPVVQILESPESNSKRTLNTNTASNDDADVENENEEEESSDGLETLAQTLKESVSELVGAGEYYKTYQSFVSRRQAAKNEKKRTLALESAIDPEKAAKRKRRKAEKNAARKRAAKSQSHSDRVLHATYQVFDEGERVSLRDDV